MGLVEPVDDLLPILGICEDFSACTSPAVHRELEAHLRTHDITGGPGWLIDMLAFTRLRLQTAWRTRRANQNTSPARRSNVPSIQQSRSRLRR